MYVCFFFFKSGVRGKCGDQEDRVMSQYLFQTDHVATESQISFCKSPYPKGMRDVRLPY